MHVFRDVTSLVGAGFNDIASSIVILEGNWEFFLNENHGIKMGGTLGPGLYPSVTATLGGGTNDQLTSLRPV